MIGHGFWTLRLIRRGLAASHWPDERLREQQWQCLRRLVAHAYENVPMYRALYDRHRFQPCHLRGLDDLGRIPMLAKEHLRAAPLGARVARQVRTNRCRRVSTSGSTGTPLELLFCPRDQVWQRAAAWRVQFEHGYRLSDRTMEIRMQPARAFSRSHLALRASFGCRYSILP